MAERSAALGYAALGKESTKGTAVTPGVYVPYYDQNIATDPNVISDQPIAGNKYRTYQALQGQRSHKGTITVMAEPNTTGYWLDMLLTKISTTGSNPYTHIFGLSATTDPNSYTLDVSLVSQVVRFFGVQASKMSPTFAGDEMQHQITLSALGSFYGAEIASVATNVLTLVTTHDPTPTAGLVASDLVAVKKVDGSLTTNFTVTSFTGTTVTLSATAAAFAAGDMLVLRAATPSYTLLTPFLWPTAQFCFGATASAALSATQTRLDSGTQIDLLHDFADDGGSPRSGSYDPASLIRTVGDAKFKIKQYFDNPDQLKQWLATAKNACVMRAYASGTTYELRVTLNNLKIAKLPIQTKFGQVIFQEEEMVSQWDTSDSQGMLATLINATVSY